jgi:hypothetical protein
VKKLILSLAFLAPFAAHAVGTYTGLVQKTYPMATGHLLVEVTAITGSPACSAFSRFLIDTSTTGGKEQANWIRFASALGRTVTVIGTGTCVTSPAFQTESVDYIQVYQ